jgi:site-specific DNA-methyltransferase (adenine-specific)
MTAMALMKDKEFDLAIVDPPYAVGADDGNFGRGGNRAIQNTSETAAGYRKELRRYANATETPDGKYFEQLFRISENQIIWGANYYPQYLNHSGWIVWDKKKTDGLLSQAELAYQSLNKLVKIYSFQWEGFKKGSGSFEHTSSKTIHPNQKPVALYQWLLKNYGKPGDRILDTHLGSGSSAIAADIMGFDFVGYEIDKDYYEAALDRFNRHKQQCVLEFA